MSCVSCAPLFPRWPHIGAHRPFSSGIWLNAALAHPFGPENQNKKKKSSTDTLTQLKIELGILNFVQCAVFFSLFECAQVKCLVMLKE